MSNGIAGIVQRLADLERRVSRMILHGPVTDRDPGNGQNPWRVRVRIGGTDEEPQKSPWVPYSQIAGGLKIHDVPTIGQQLTLLSPDGVMEQAIAIPLTWSDANPSPSRSGDENVLTFGNVKVTIKDGLVEVKVGNTVFRVKTGGIEATAADYDWK